MAGHGFRYLRSANASDRSQPNPAAHFGGAGATAADRRDVRGHHAGESPGYAEHGDPEGGLLQTRPAEPRDSWSPADSPIPTWNSANSPARCSNTNSSCSTTRITRRSSPRSGEVEERLRASHAEAQAGADAGCDQFGFPQCRDRWRQPDGDEDDPVRRARLARAARSMRRPSPQQLDKAEDGNDALAKFLGPAPACLR